VDVKPFVESFPALAEIGFLRHTFVGRIPGIDVKVDRDEALARLEKHHIAALRELGEPGPFIIGTQIHGRDIATVTAQTVSPVADVDGLITNSPDVTLGIYVADCCAIYLTDPKRRVIGLLHSGRKGTELNIVAAAVEKMRSQFGCAPGDLLVQLSPCIRPPHYEVDFAARIVDQCRAAGIVQIFDCGTCTASNLDRYYSYRAELGKTGRMLAAVKMTK
jgi:copper oxidase (laccase) domain-containing protein